VTTFKTDENPPIEVAAVLGAHALDAATVLEEGLDGHPDIDIAEACRRGCRSLITLDVHFANIDAYPPADHPGILVLRLARQDMGHALGVVRRLMPYLVGVHGSSPGETRRLRSYGRSPVKPLPTHRP
jgi:predicted nuclease of predicted toxin-antitoxin system